MLFRSNKIALNLKETPEGLFELILTYNQESKDTINSVVTSWDAYSDRNRWDNTEIPGLIKKSYEILYPIKDKDKEKDKRLFREQTSLATKLLSFQEIKNYNIEFYSDECTPEQIDRYSLQVKRNNNINNVEMVKNITQSLKNRKNSSGVLGGLFS